MRYNRNWERCYTIVTANFIYIYSRLHSHSNQTKQIELRTRRDCEAKKKVGQVKLTSTWPVEFHAKFIEPTQNGHFVFGFNPTLKKKDK